MKAKPTRFPNRIDRLRDRGIQGTWWGSWTTNGVDHEAGAGRAMAMSSPLMWSEGLLLSICRGSWSQREAWIRVLNRRWNKRL